MSFTEFLLENSFLKSFREGFRRLLGKEQEADLKAKLMDFMGDAVSLKNEGKTLASWSLPSSRKTIDSTKLKTTFPDAYEECMKAGAPVRTFRIYQPKEAA